MPAIADGPVGTVYCRDQIADNHVANSLGDLVTGKQLGMIRSLGREIGIDLTKECAAVMKCNFDELSKHGASQFITHLQELRKTAEEAAAKIAVRKAS